MAVTKTVNVEATNARASTTLTDTTPTVPLPDTPQGLMVIGPQVTLHFVEDVWNKANSYDYYDVVQVDGTSYIAVQDVPANTEITNSAYWAKWNDPNAQVAQMQDTISTFDGRITENTNNITKLGDELDKKGRTCAVLIGNSFTVGYYTHNYGIADALSDAGFFDEQHVYASDSSSFDDYTLGGVTINATNNFNSLVNQAGDDPSFDNGRVTHVIFISAMGDTRALAYKFQANKNDLPTFSNLDSTVENAKSKFPNAHIYVYFAEWIDKRNTQENYSVWFPYMQLRAHYLFSYNTRFTYLGWGGFVGNLNSNYTRFRMDDGYHPTHEGSDILANNLMAKLSGGIFRIGFLNPIYSDGFATSTDLGGVIVTTPEYTKVSIPPIPASACSVGQYDITVNTPLADGSTDTICPIFVPETKDWFSVSLPNDDNTRTTLTAHITGKTVDFDTGELKLTATFIENYTKTLNQSGHVFIYMNNTYLTMLTPLVTK